MRQGLRRPRGSRVPWVMRSLALCALFLTGCLTARAAVAPTITHRGDPGVDGVVTLGLAKAFDDDHGVYFTANAGASKLPGEGRGVALHDLFGVDFLSEDEPLPWRVGLRAGARIGFEDDDEGAGVFGVRAAIFPWSSHRTSSCHEKGLDLWCGETSHRNLGFEAGFDVMIADGASGRTTFLFLLGPVIELNILD